MYVNTLIGLEENVPTYGIDGKRVNGHVTITTPGFIKCYVQNLNPKDNKALALYVFSSKDNKGVRIGNLMSPNQSKETRWKINENNVMSSSIKAKDIDAAAVVKEGSSMRNTDTILVGFARTKYVINAILEELLPEVIEEEIMGGKELITLIQELTGPTQGLVTGMQAPTGMQSSMQGMGMTGQGAGMQGMGMTGQGAGMQGMGMTGQGAGMQGMGMAGQGTGMQGTGMAGQGTGMQGFGTAGQGSGMQGTGMTGQGSSMQGFGMTGQGTGMQGSGMQGKGMTGQGSSMQGFGMAGQGAGTMGLGMGAGMQVTGVTGPRPTSGMQATGITGPRPTTGMQGFGMTGQMPTSSLQNSIRAIQELIAAMQGPVGPARGVTAPMQGVTGTGAGTMILTSGQTAPVQGIIESEAVKEEEMTGQNEDMNEAGAMNDTEEMQGNGESSLCQIEKVLQEAYTKQKNAAVTGAMQNNNQNQEMQPENSGMQGETQEEMDYLEEIERKLRDIQARLKVSDSLEQSIKNLQNSTTSCKKAHDTEQNKNSSNVPIEDIISKIVEFKNNAFTEGESAQASSSGNALSRLYSGAPRINPFEYDQYGVDWVRISIEDLSRADVLPKQWCTQPFVTFSYYKYNEIILGKERGADKYYLGIPDIYHPERRNILETDAKVETFLCQNNVVPAIGDYGYWLISL